VIILGDSGAGKTSLISCFQSNKFDKVCSTSCDNYPMAFKLLGGKIIKLEIKDTLGQERYREIYNSFYKKADCCILVYNIADSSSFEECINKFNNKIKKNCKKNIKVALCGNMIDLENKREISFEKAAKFASENNYIFMETSCKQMLNVKNIFEYLITTTFLDSKDLLNNNLKNLQDFNNNLIKEIEQLKYTNDILIKKLQELEVYNNNLKENLNSSDILLNDLKENIKKLDNSKSKLEEKIEELESLNQDLKYNFQVEKSSKQTMQEGFEEMKRIVIAQEKSLNNEKEKYEQLNKKLKELEELTNKDTYFKKLFEMMEEIKQKDKEISELKNKFHENENNLISIILVSNDENIYCSIICKNIYNFEEIENLFYDKYPEFKKLNNQFFINGIKINENKTLEENSIFDNSIIYIKSKL